MPKVKIHNTCYVSLSTEGWFFSNLFWFNEWDSKINKKSKKDLEMIVSNCYFSFICTLPYIFLLSCKKYNHALCTAEIQKKKFESTTTDLTSFSIYFLPLFGRPKTISSFLNALKVRSCIAKRITMQQLFSREKNEQTLYGPQYEKMSLQIKNLISKKQF